MDDFERSNMKTYTVYSLLLVALLVTAGCSTPGYRISKNQELFDGFSPEIQVNVRAGKVDIGYTKAMADLALGPPNREYTRRTATGTTEIWSYTKSYTTSDRQRVEGTFRVRDSGGRYRTVSDSIWVDVDKEHEYEYKRIEFVNGAIKAIEEINR